MRRAAEEDAPVGLWLEDDVHVLGRPREAGSDGGGERACAAGALGNRSTPGKHAHEDCRRRRCRFVFGVGVDGKRPQANPGRPGP